MTHYLVFTARKYKNVMGVEGLTWELAGVFRAENETRACLKGMHKTGHATAFAIQGFALGVDMEDVSDVDELGVRPDPVTRLERMGERLTSRLSELASARTAPELTEGDNDTGS